MPNRRGATPQPYSQTVTRDGEKSREQRVNAAGQLGWRLRVYDARASRQPESIFWGTYETAVRELHRLQSEQEKTTAPAVAHAKAVTVGEWLLEWLPKYVWSRKPSSNGAFAGVRRPYSTYTKVKNMLTIYLVPALGEDMRMSRVTHDLLLDTIAGLTTKDGTPLAASSKATVAGAARSFFNGAVLAGVIPASPAASLPTVWDEGGTSRAALIPSILEVEKLAAQMDADWPLPPWARDLYGPNGEGRGDLVRLLAYTGMRFEEFAALPAARVSPQRRVIHIDATASESGGRREYRAGQAKSDSSKRPILIVDQALPALRRLNAIRKRGLELEPARAARREARNVKRQPAFPPEGPWTLLVCGERGGFQGYSHWRKQLERAQTATGVSYSAHELRHVCASILYAAGEDEYVIAAQMGHSSPNTTRRIYRHMFLVDHTEIARRVSEKIAAITDAEMAAAEGDDDGLEDADW